MELFKLEWGWKIIFVLTIIVVFICAMSFDMITNWEKRKRSDMIALILGITGYTCIILAMTTNNAVTLFALVSVVTLGIAGYVGATNDFDTQSSAPWELWLIAFLSIAALLAAMVWAYYHTGAGRYVGAKFDSAGTYIKDRRNKWGSYSDRDKPPVTDNLAFNLDEIKKSDARAYNEDLLLEKAKANVYNGNLSYEERMSARKVIQRSKRGLNLPARATYNSTPPEYTHDPRRYTAWTSRHMATHASEFDPLSDLELN